MGFISRMVWSIKMKAFLIFLLQMDDFGRTKDWWGQNSDTPAFSTCSNADILRLINAMLNDFLDSGAVKTTPKASGKCDPPKGILLLCM